MCTACLAGSSTFAGVLGGGPSPGAVAESPPVAVAVSAPAADQPARPWIVAGQVGGALTLPSVDFAVEVGRRWQRFGVLVKADWNRWVNTQKPPMLTLGTLNVGLGADYRSMQGRLRTAIAAGPSILLFRTMLDKPGKVGLFFDCYPASFLGSVHGPVFVRFDPLSFHIVAPVLDSIPLVVFEYRTSVALEWRL